ncbi:MAG: NUDIX hydrolase [Nocardioidaceae bacterium]
MDPGESPEEAARRELSAGTGYAADSIQLVAKVVQASSTHVQFVAIGRGCRLVGEQHLEELEDCEVLVVRPDEVRRLLRAEAMNGTQLVWPALDHAGPLSREDCSLRRTSNG